MAGAVSVMIGVGVRVIIRLPNATEAFPILRTIFIRSVQPAGTTSTTRMILGVCPAWSGLGCARRVEVLDVNPGVASASLGLVASFVTVVTMRVVLAIALILLRVIPGVVSHGWRQLVDTKVRTNLLARIDGYSGTPVFRSCIK
nr:hypothetical protein [Tanacetum cinerariifolium]